MNKNVARGQATRAHLIDVATRLFTERGYDGTSIEAVLAESGVSRGSLYHHFPGKEALFWAVLEGVATRVGEELAAATRDIQDPVAALRAECLAWIRLAGDPVVQQTALIDAPAVLGWQRWRELDEQGSLDTFAHIVLAATYEVALMIARAEDPAPALSAGESAMADFLDRLLGAPG